MQKSIDSVAINK